MKILLLFSILLISSCGFKPLYGTQNGEVSEIVQQVTIATIDGRNGQVLHNHLLDIMNPNGRPTSASYTLASELTISSTSLGVQADDTTTRKSSVIRGNFILTSKDFREGFSIIRQASFSETDNIYATSVAENDAVARILREMAEDAKIRVASILKRIQ